MRSSYEPQDTSTPRSLSAATAEKQEKEIIFVSASDAKILQEKGWHVVTDSDLCAGGEV